MSRTLVELDSRHEGSSFLSSLRTAVTGRRRSSRLPSAAVAGDVVTEARGATLSLDGTPVLRDVSVQVRAGEVRALLGPNGAGKSSLLGALTGDLPLDGGSVLVDGAPLRSWTPTELAMRRAVLMQQIHLSFPFTSLDVVQMGRAPWRGTPLEEADDEVVGASLAATDVTHLAGRHFPSLSGGEKARVALARVLAQRTGLLMLDEPTAALDLKHQELVLQIARRHAEAGGAVVVVVHDLGLASAYADQVTLLSGGRVVADGSPREVLTAELLSEVYDYPVEIVEHPDGGAPIILPARSAAAVPPR
ncbi:heme ABC transporter ATP-binding protein [Oerskovia turbata]|uniref:Heme ABC transporter ATP-binding protein n=1 Tax=Oerskovia turbata TaxID=1713 RepID=A0A4Q1KRK6_9CELL|nr:heme ABC transporter ATP-binding protein [Oerskovia turbata]RXR25331.1 heme ABC transporter ATP-binding protein [Oerskovia turbata]RXR32728.1 heme ABC transporter ATP-binding protein [Oerskovia turbata]TGJ95595.1 heme ABC transporter ATP-binding protein [Actinotalea fermentans ATCC 43279 = JCM 9966 = DSM 3133]